MSDPIFTLFTDGTTRNLGKGDMLFRSGAPVRQMFLVTQGEIDLVRHTRSGTRILLQRARVGDVLAEASAYSGAYHCDGVAAGAARIGAIPVPTFRTRLDENPALAGIWAGRLAHRLQGARLNAAIRTIRTVEERLEAWLADGRGLPPKGEWQGLAETLGVSREALYRELSRRRIGGSPD